MLETTANIVTILVLGASVVYSIVKFTRAAWRRIRPVLAAQARFRRIIANLGILFASLGLSISVLFVVQDTAMLFDYVYKISDEVRGNSRKIKRLKNRFSQGVSPKVTNFYWKQGQSPVQMIPTSQGICYLTYVRGKFEGTRESVSITQDNGHWYLSGDSRQVAVKAGAACWKFPEEKDNGGTNVHYSK